MGAPSRAQSVGGLESLEQMRRKRHAATKKSTQVSGQNESVPEQHFDQEKKCRVEWNGSEE